MRLRGIVWGLTFSLPFWGLLAACLVLWGCVSPEAADAWAGVRGLLDAAHADGVVTSAEAEAIATAARAAGDLAAVPDLGTLLATGLSSVLTAILGANWWRNHNLWGSSRRPAPGVDRPTT